MNIITDISNGVAKIKVAGKSHIEALAEVDERYMKVGDEVHDHELVYNGGDRRYDELYTRYVGEENIQ